MAHKKQELPKKELEKQLSDALPQTFPASDPVSVGQPTSTEPDRPAHRRTPVIDKALVNDLARKAARQQSKG